MLLLNVNDAKSTSATGLKIDLCLIKAELLAPCPERVGRPYLRSRLCLDPAAIDK